MSSWHVFIPYTSSCTNTIANTSASFSPNHQAYHREYIQIYAGKFGQKMNLMMQDSITLEEQFYGDKTRLGENSQRMASECLFGVSMFYSCLELG
jgi:hypothetical protein